MRSVFFTEVRRSPMLYALPILIFLCGMAAWRSLIPGVNTWDANSLAILSGIQLLGPVAAGISCWIAQRERQRRLAYLRILSDDRNGLVPVVQLASAVTWTVGAVLFVYSALAIQTIYVGGYGSVSVSALFSACMGAAVHTAFGYLAGWLIPRTVVAPIVALAAYVYIVLNLDYPGSWFYLLAPVTSERPSVFVEWQSHLFLTQGAWLACVLVLLAALCAISSVPRKIYLAAGGTSLALALCFGLMLQSYDGYVFAGGFARPEPVCKGQSPTVCVHPAFKDSAQPVSNAFRQLSARFGTSPLAFDRLEQRATGDFSPLPKGTLRVTLDDEAPGYMDLARSYFVTDLVDQAACSRRKDIEGRAYTEVVSAWLLDTQIRLPSRFQDAEQKFQNTTEEKRRKWFGNHVNDFRTCGLSSESFDTVS
ncbi:hypothetical protein [Streptomyces sp. NPDC002845]